MAEQISTPAPIEGARGRKVTDKRGGHIEPEGARARFTGVKRGTMPMSPFPSPEGASRQGPSGDSQENTMISDVVPPIATRKPGPDATRRNPAKG